MNGCNASTGSVFHQRNEQVHSRHRGAVEPRAQAPESRESSPECAGCRRRWRRRACSRRSRRESGRGSSRRRIGPTSIPKPASATRRRSRATRSSSPKPSGAAIGAGDFPLVLGGDCSILLGSLLALRRRGRYGLFFVDGHADFATPATSPSQGAAGMDLSLATGRGPAAALQPRGPEPARARRGRRSRGIPRRGDAATGDRRLSGRSAPFARASRRSRAARSARLRRHGVEGFWIHVDADVLDPEIMPAVDTPEPGGLELSELTELLRELLAVGPRRRDCRSASTTRTSIPTGRVRARSSGSSARRFPSALASSPCERRGSTRGGGRAMGAQWNRAVVGAGPGRVVRPADHPPAARVPARRLQRPGAAEEPHPPRRRRAGRRRPARLPGHQVPHDVALVAQRDLRREPSAAGPRPASGRAAPVRRGGALPDRRSARRPGRRRFAADEVHRLQHPRLPSRGSVARADRDGPALRPLARRVLVRPPQRLRPLPLPAAGPPDPDAPARGGVCTSGAARTPRRSAPRFWPRPSRRSASRSFRCTSGAPPSRAGSCGSASSGGPRGAPTAGSCGPATRASACRRTSIFRRTSTS